MLKRITIPPYDEYQLSTFVITDDQVHIGHFGGYVNEEGQLLETIEEQMEQSLKNLDNALRQIELDLKSVVKLTVILKDISDFRGMHQVWMRFFKEGDYPVRTVITSDFVSDRCLVQLEGAASYSQA